MTDIDTIAEIGTALGTLFLGLATFAAVRSANQAARVSERSLLLGMRPVLTPARPEDPDQRVLFGDGRSFQVRSDTGLAEEIDGIVYLAIPVHNVGTGLAVLQRYDIVTGIPLLPAQQRLEPERHDRQARHYGPVEHFRYQQRDLYVASGDNGYWQAALRDPDDEVRADVIAAIRERAPISVDLLYGDHEGGQPTVSRFTLVPGPTGEWLPTVAFHWSVRGPDPREQDF